MATKKPKTQNPPGTKIIHKFRFVVLGVLKVKTTPKHNPLSSYEIF